MIYDLPLYIKICVFIAMWIISQGIIYVFLYYKIHIAKKNSWLRIFNKSIYICYIGGLLAASCVFYGDKEFWRVFYQSLLDIKIENILNVWNLLITLVVSVVLFLFVCFFQYLISKLNRKKNKIELENIQITFFSIVFVPIVEEILFRSMFFQSLNEILNVGASVIISAFIFGVIHLKPKNIISAFVGGVCFSLIYLYSEALIISIVGHSLFNLIVGYYHRYKKSGVSI